MCPISCNYHPMIFKIKITWIFSIWLKIFSNGYFHLFFLTLMNSIMSSPFKNLSLNVLGKRSITDFIKGPKFLIWFRKSASISTKDIIQSYSNKDEKMFLIVGPSFNCNYHLIIKPIYFCLWCHESIDLRIHTDQNYFVRNSPWKVIKL